MNKQKWALIVTLIVALIGAAATITAAVINRSGSGSSPVVLTVTTSATATTMITPQATETQPSRVTPPSGQPPTVDAVSTLDTFCQDISAGAMQWAYNLTSQNYRNQHTINDFSNQFSNVDISSGSGCLAGNTTVSGSNVVIPLTIHYRNGFQTSTSYYTATLIQNPQSHTWVIDSIV